MDNEDTRDNKKNIIEEFTLSPVHVPTSQKDFDTLRVATEMPAVLKWG